MPFRNGIRKLVAFDWNGTLLADARIIFQCTNMILRELGHGAIDLATYRNCYDIPLERFYERIGLGADVFHARKDITNHLFHQTYESMATKTRLRRGAKEVLGQLQRHAVHAVILSNHSVPDIDRHLARLDVKPYIATVLANESTDVKHRRPKGERLQQLMKKYQIAGKDVLIVGDSHEETQIAHELGAVSVAVTDGHVSTARLKEAKPHYLINHLREVEDIARERGMF